MLTGRREVVRTVTVLIGIALLGMWTGKVMAYTPASGMFPFANLEASRMVYIEYPDRIGFNRARAGVFKVDMGPDARPMRLKLVRVIPLSGSTYVLKFRSWDRRKLENDTYLLEHRRLGPMPLFLTHNPVRGKIYRERFLRGGKQKIARKKIYEAIVELPSH